LKRKGSAKIRLQMAALTLGKTEEKKQRSRRGVTQFTKLENYLNHHSQV
jgi:hypothetical protein